MEVPLGSFQGAGNKPRPRFELGDNSNAVTTTTNAATAAANNTTKAEAFANAAVSALSNKDDKEEGGKRRPSYMPTRGLAAVLNQGLATLGEKLGNFLFTDKF